MAKVKIEEIVYRLDTEFRQALDDTIRRHIPGATYNSQALFNTFQQAVYNRCSVWEEVPDDIVEK